MQKEKRRHQIKSSVNPIQNHPDGSRAERINTKDRPRRAVPESPVIPCEKKYTRSVAAETLEQEEQTKWKDQYPVAENGNGDGIRVPRIVTAYVANGKMNQN
jgi:hypothetical protein